MKNRSVTGFASTLDLPGSNRRHSSSALQNLDELGASTIGHLATMRAISNIIKITTSWGIPLAPAA